MPSVSIPTLACFLVGFLQTSLLTIITLPLPLKWRKALLTNLLESVIFAKLIFGLKISAIFVLILFVDASNTFLRLSSRDREHVGGTALDGGDAGTPVSLDRQARILLAERNATLSGATLYLTYLLWRVFEHSIETIRLNERLAAKEGRDLGKPIDASREEFKHLQDAQKPDFEKQAAQDQAIRKRQVAVDASSAPEPKLANNSAK